MKKLFLLLLSMTLMFSLAACSGKKALIEGESLQQSDIFSKPSTETFAVSEPSTEASVTSEPSTEASVTSEPSSEGPADSEPLSEATAVSEPSDADVPEKSTEPTSESGGILVAYFSWSGNTEQMAQMIQAETAGDLFEIEPATPYTDNYNTLLDIAQQEQADNARPKLAS